jgi:hypothetical protein
MLASSTDFKNNVYAPIRQFDARVTITLQGTTTTYGDDKIIRMNILEEISTLNDTVPSNELQLTMDNSDGEFNLLNFQNMQQIIASKPKIVTELGLVLANYQADTTLLNFLGKIAGSIVENGNIIKYSAGSTLIVPASFSVEGTQSHYDSVKVLEGNLFSAATTTSGSIRQVLFSFNILRILEEKFGSVIWQGKTTISEKVELAKAYISSLKGNWWGRGSGPNGNKASFQIWNSGSSNWQGLQTSTSSNITQLFITPAIASSHIDSTGFVHFIAYAEASDGITASRVYTDYIELIVETAPIYVVEWKPAGVFFLSDWKNEKTSKTITMTANDYFNMLGDISYDPTTSTNLATLASEVLTKGDVPVADQVIDSSLSAITVNKFTERLDCRTALQHIGIAGQCAVFQDRNGKVVIKPFRTIDASSNFVTYASAQNAIYHYAGSNMYALNNTEGGMKYIDFDQMYDMPEVTLDKSIYQLIVKVYSGGTAVERVYTNTSIAGQNGQSFTIDNPLVNSNTLADKIADWFIRESNYNAIYKANWRQNPILECADIVLVEDSFDANKQTRIYKQEFNYEGYLSGITESRGGI